MELLKTFGFDITLFAAQIVNFLVLFFLLKKFMYKPMLNMLNERKRKITEGLKHAEESALLLEETLKKEESILKKAHEEARTLIDEAKAKQTEIMQQTEERAKQQAETMLAEARTQITFETAQAEKRLTGYVSQLALQFLQQATRDLFSEKEQEMIMKNAIKKLKEKRIN